MGNAIGYTYLPIRESNLNLISLELGGVPMTIERLNERMEDYHEGKLPAGLKLDLEEAAGIHKIDVIDMNDPVIDAIRKRIEEQGTEICRRDQH